jgi:hypothetical protein
MNCRVVLLNEEKNKVIKVLTINEANYSLCEDRVKALNDKIKYPKKYVLTDINV